MTWTPDPGDDPRVGEQRRQAVERAANDAITHWAPRAMFVLVPVFAALVAVAARRSPRNFPQHLYFAFHVHASWFFAGAVAAGAAAVQVPYLSSVVSATASFYGFVYLVLAFRRAYDVPPRRAVLRSIAVGGAYAVAVIATLDDDRVSCRLRALRLTAQAGQLSCGARRTRSRFIFAQAARCSLSDASTRAQARRCSER